MRHRSYNNNYQTVLNGLPYYQTVLNGLLQLVLQLTEPMCRMILLLIKAAMAVLYCLLLALPLPAVLNGYEKER